MDQKGANQEYAAKSGVHALRVISGTGPATLPRPRPASKPIQTPASGGVPYYVQELAYHAFAQAEHTVTLADVELAVEVLVSSVAGLSGPVYERLRALERKVLLALAEQPAAQTYSAEFGFRASSSVERPLEELERVELVELSPIGWRVANPFMEIWIRTRSNP